MQGCEGRMLPPSAKTPMEKFGSIGLELVLFAGGIVAGAVVLWILYAMGILPSPEENKMAGFIAAPVLLATVGGVYWGGERLLRASGSLREPQPANPPVRAEKVSTPRALAVLGLHGLAAVGGSMLLAALMGLIGLPPAEQESVLEITGGGFSLEPALVILAVGALLLAPLTEEFVFRHMMFRRLLHRAGPTHAYFTSALMFALIHYNPQGLVIYVWLGIVFADAYRRTGRFWVPVGVHVINNVVTLALLLSGAAAAAGS